MKKIYKSYNVTFRIKEGKEISYCNINEGRTLFKIDEKNNSTSIEIEELGINYIDSISDIELQDRKFYRYPKLDLPRNKVEILKDNYNISIKRKKEDADFCIFNPDELLKHVHTSWTSFITKDELLNVIHSNKNYFFGNVYNEIIERLEKIDDDCYFYTSVHAGWQWRSGSQANNANNIVNKLESSIPKGINNFYSISLSHVDMCNNLLNTKNLISDSALLEKISQHSVTITEENYSNLDDMLRSNDNENISMALEVMSNCDIQGSYDKLACLLYYNIEWIRYAKNWNSVNVKTLRKTMSKYCDVYTAIGQTRYYNFLLKKLEEDDNLTRFAVDITRNLLYKNVMSSQFGSDSIFEFKLSDIRLKPESKLNIKNSKLDCELLEILLNDR